MPEDRALANVIWDRFPFDVGALTRIEMTARRCPKAIKQIPVPERAITILLNRIVQPRCCSSGYRSRIRAAGTYRSAMLP